MLFKIILFRSKVMSLNCINFICYVCVYVLIDLCFVLNKSLFCSLFVFYLWYKKNNYVCMLYMSSFMPRLAAEQLKQK